MSIGERDPHTGIETTGHEWCGIKELNTPIPKAVKFFYGLTFAIAVIFWILLPSWPLINSYTPGVLGSSLRQSVANSIANASAQRASWTQRIAASDIESIAADPDMFALSIKVGSRLFGDNCAVCHGSDGEGARGFPNLRDSAWLWGGSSDKILETLRVGVNSQHDDTRASSMLAFGKDEVLSRADIHVLVSYVRSLAGREPLSQRDSSTAHKLFAENCASCHGENAKGSQELGAPNLTDDIWIYGADRASVYETIFYGRKGHMPHWSHRLTPVEIKILTVYVGALSKS